MRTADQTYTRKHYPLAEREYASARESTLCTGELSNKRSQTSYTKHTHANVHPSTLPVLPLAYELRRLSSEEYTSELCNHTGTYINAILLCLTKVPLQGGTHTGTHTNTETHTLTHAGPALHLAYFTVTICTHRDIDRAPDFRPPNVAALPQGPAHHTKHKRGTHTFQRTNAVHTHSSKRL